MPSPVDRSSVARWIRRALLFLLIFQSVSATSQGCELVADPSGEAIGLSLELIDGSIFQSYLVPGLILLIVLGVGPLLAAYGLWRGHRWAWRASFVLGCALVIWIAVQIAIIGYHADPPLQLIYGSIGAAIAVLAIIAERQKAIYGNRADG
jgi:hypothetical protein